MLSYYSEGGIIYINRCHESFYLLLLLLLLAFSKYDCPTIILFHVFCIHVAIVGQIARYPAIVYFNCITRISLYALLIYRVQFIARFILIKLID